MSNIPQKPVHKWDSDRPGELPEHDELGRKEFAQRVAIELRGWRNKDSLVVSLNGEWGSGKTTLANLILHYIEVQADQARETKPIVVKFNPWQWSGQDKLLEAFFDEVGTAFRPGRINDKAIAKNLARFWDGLKVATVAGGDLARRLQESLTAAAALLAGGSGMVSSFATNPTAKAVLSWTSFVLLGIAGLCAVYAPLAEKLAEVCERLTKKPALTMDEVRANLRRELGKLEAPLLVVIDDIDRLTKREVRLLVQLVKTNADFPNVVYLLLYQKRLVADALDEVVGEKGQDFIKKIVQVELDLPVAPEQEMLRFFRKQIDPVLSRAKIRWEKDRWEGLFDEGLWPYFRTPRDIKRFKGVLEFYYEGHVNEGVLEVNPIDLVLLETLRMFDPLAYEEVGRAFQKQRNIFLASLFYDNEAKDRLCLGITELLGRKELTKADRNRLTVVLYGLFPQAQKSFNLSKEQEEVWERNFRICHPKYFRRYFQLGGDGGGITAAFFSKLFRTGNNCETFRALLKKEFDAGNFVPVMDRLRVAREDVPKFAVEPLITALFDLSDNLPHVDKGVFTSDAERQLVSIVVVLLSRIEEKSERGAVLSRAVLASSAITGPVLCLAYLNPKKEAQETILSLPISIEDLQKMQAELLPRLWTAAQDGRLWKLRMAAAMIYGLRDWAGIEDVRKWLSEALQKPTIAGTFLRKMLHELQVNSSRGTRIVYTLPGTQLEEFIDLSKLADAAHGETDQDLDKAAVEALRAAIRLRSEGKPYSNIYVLSHDEDGHFISDSSDAEL